MSGFSADWLALREAADHAARSVAMTEAAGNAVSCDTPIRILDLAAGTGSNFRYLSRVGFAPSPGVGEGRPGARRDDRRASWLLVDHDPDLLARVPASPDVETRCLDLSTLDDPELFAGRSLVTASALLDLVSEPWLRSLAARCAERGAVALFALTYDGRIGCSPEDPDDASIVALVNEHQCGDKGFGPAAGPEATDVASQCFAKAGYRVRCACSDWVLTPEAAELQRRLIDGWAQAAAAIAPARARVIDGWRDRRFAHVAAGWSTITVGHQDLVGIPE